LADGFLQKPVDLGQLGHPVESGRGHHDGDAVVLVQPTHKGSRFPRSHRGQLDNARHSDPLRQAE